MQRAALPVHPGLADGSRLGTLTEKDQPMLIAEWIALVGAGIAAAAAAAFLDFGLRIPGHAIIRIVLPMSFGLAVAPRRMAGMIMGASALLSAVTIQAGGLATLGVGAMTSLTLTGPLLDLSLWRAKGGLRLYAGFALAGAASNLLALAVRTGAKSVGLDRVTSRPLAFWLPQAVVTYVVCGVLAGLICAAIWFHYAGGSKAGSPETTR